MAGSRNSSLAQAPKSTPLQRALQNGRYAFDGAYRLGPWHAGHVTRFIGSDSIYRLQLGAKSQFKGDVRRVWLHPIMDRLGHEPDGRHQAVGTNFWNRTQRGVDR